MPVGCRENHVLAGLDQDKSLGHAVLITDEEEGIEMRQREVSVIYPGVPLKEKGEEGIFLWVICLEQRTSVNLPAPPGHSARPTPYDPLSFHSCFFPTSPLLDWTGSHHTVYLEHLEMC